MHHTQNSHAFGTASTIALALATASLAAQPARAQVAPGPTLSTAAMPTAASGQVVGEVMVTATRILRDGFTAPTPTTVMGLEDIHLAAKPSIADVVNELPQLQGSVTPATNNAQISVGSGGQNLLNLRGLGPQRTLVLMDGRRVTPTTLTGTADINNIPSQAVKRVDVVTGGASAAHGSDAVSGVVNFVLDTNFVGLKGAINGGISSRNDNGENGVSLTFGRRLMDGRLHLLFSGHYADSDGIDGIDPSKRKWFTGTRLINNPAYISQAATPNTPALVTAQHVNVSNSAPGGLILSGPLAGTTFGPGGIASRFQFGSLVQNGIMVGGQTGDPGAELALVEAVKSGHFLGRAGFDVTENAEAYVQYLWGHSQSAGSGPLGRVNSFNVSTANPYLPASLRAQAAAGGPAFQFGTAFADFGKLYQDNSREMNQITLGLRGQVFGSWRWDAYYQYGRSDVHNQLRHNINRANLALAADVITGPNGQPACRTFATNPACSPLNIFGTGVMSPASIAYATGTSDTQFHITQEVAEASLSGEPITLWAGPVSVAAGIGYRREATANTFVDPVSLNGLTGGWAVANYRPTNGSYEVNEVFGETVVPLASEAPWAKSLEFNGAVRFTNYSTSGTETTWKAGLNYRPVQDILMRGTLSRDIRAPNLADLFLGGTSNVAPNVLDPKYGNQLISTTIVNANNGNLELRPERSNNKSVGIVYQPSWFTGFSASVDYYEYTIRSGIYPVSVQSLVNDCFTGIHPEYCAFVTRGPGTVGGVARPDTVVATVSKPFNLAEFHAEGLDIEVSYRKTLSDWDPAWDGTLVVRTLATHAITETQDNGAGVVHEFAGELGTANTTGANVGGAVPNWKASTQITYLQGPLTVSANWRFISSGVYSTSFFDTRTGPLTVDDNHIPAVSYFDLGATYRFVVNGANFDVYGRITNLFDKDPPVVTTTNTLSQQYNPSLYDPVGRYYRMGLRFQF